MRVISWNINSVRARSSRLLELLNRHDPDIVCLQETKTKDRYFPISELSAVGYTAILNGQESYNGVAILIRSPPKQHNLYTHILPQTQKTGKTDQVYYKPTDIYSNFPANPVPSEARLISANIGGIRVVNVYVINGESRESIKFGLKQVWMDALGKWIQSLPRTPPLLMVGDFNVAPENCDVWDPEGLQERIHCTREEREWLIKLKGERLYDILRKTNPNQKMYTWWPYQRDAFEQDEGLRFDLALGDSQLVRLTKRVWVDRDERKPDKTKEPPSDHAPVIIDLYNAPTTQKEVLKRR